MVGFYLPISSLTKMDRIGAENVPESRDDEISIQNSHMNGTSSTEKAMNWTVGTVFLSLFLFVVAGLAEIGGGWLMWQTLRENRSWLLALAGAIVLVIYGIIPTFQPEDSFGRVYAVYGGFFIILSYLWGWMVDGDRPDIGDWIGASLAITGVILALFWPR